MTNKVVTVEMDDTLLTISMIFENVKFRHLLVVENKKLVGVISDRDFLRAISPFLKTASETTRDQNTLNRRVHQIMSRNPITVNPETSIESAAGTMLRNNISCLPVVSFQDRLEGIATWKDILKYYLRNK
ncbi:MAG: CBS domain-containing protein [Planctomycetes bacterium]|nr:CBS domain-containing protein [Planctomycetota bacterium]